MVNEVIDERARAGESQDERARREALLQRMLGAPMPADGKAAATRRAAVPPLAWLLGALVLAQGLVLGYLLLGPKDAESVPAPVASAAAAPASTPPPAVPATRLEASGYISAARVATVSARTLGLITEVTIEEGSQVEAGQVLARLEDTQARLELGLAQARRRAAEARLRSSEAQAEEARQTLERERSLRGDGYASAASIERAATALATARAQVDLARADLQLSALEVQRFEVLLADHSIRAPFAGVVVSKNAQPGEVLAPSAAGGGYTRTGICTIVDMASLEIVVDVNEQMIGRVQPGQAVEAELYAHPGWTIAGRVHKVMPNADRARGTVRVRIELLDSDPRILPDKAVKVAFLDGEGLADVR